MGILERDLLLDSVIVIDHLNGIEPATRFLAVHRSRAAITPVTRAEVLAGLDAGDAPMCARLLDHFPTLNIDGNTADVAAGLRREHGLRLPDAFQAALALQHGMKLVTRDLRELSLETFGFVTVPYEV